MEQDAEGMARAEGFREGLRAARNIVDRLYASPDVRYVNFTTLLEMFDAAISAVESYLPPGRKSES